MKTKKFLVKSMFMNILTAGIFAFAFAACSDDLEMGNNPYGETQSQGKETLLEAYGLTYQTFIDENDVQAGQQRDEAFRVQTALLTDGSQ